MTSTNAHFLFIHRFRPRHPVEFRLNDKYCIRPYLIDITMTIINLWLCDCQRAKSRTQMVYEKMTFCQKPPKIEHEN